MTAPITRVGLYGRVSTPDQDPSSQLARLRDWAGRQGLEVALEEVDTASGRLVRRPGMDRIMVEARGHHIAAVAVVKVDRWARSVMHLATTARELHDLGIAFYAVDQGLAILPNRADPTGALILNVLASVAEWEAQIISERTKDALRHLKASGKRLGRPPKKGMPFAPTEKTSSPAGGP
ncbi:MAG TPA: recombinase family protein [Thermoplasmata archaeon]|nr:recombinase family protein [Thermoplasmata archaeon]